MARSFANVKLLTAALVFDGFSNTISRRGYAAATQGIASSATKGGVSSKMAKKTGEEAVGATEKEAWVPDPKTGNYRPANTNEIDAADLRAMLLNKKN
ncbi:Late embryogenesis abundant protein Lea5 [Quillaja saponaria]|uniref:Late embryogenesis abundant protein Lea5 n=1 Tax=Quillaja saponaria TaxID=32244 RepID=A0AAD7Q184_QUISA|nr:Late embryogenesis abundant protein Lea5 [Quillaja saponaria]